MRTSAVVGPYLELGHAESSPPVIYLHEAGIDIRHAARLPVVTSIVGEGGRVILPELPLHGARTGSRPYSAELDRLEVVDHVSREISGLLDELGDPEYTVVGGSLGGLCAIACAIREPRVGQLAAFLAPFNWDPRWRQVDSEALASCNPRLHAATLLDREVLLVHGQADRWAPPPNLGVDVPHPEAWAAAGGKLDVAILDHHPHRHSERVAARIAAWIQPIRDRRHREVGHHD